MLLLHQSRVTLSVHVVKYSWYQRRCKSPREEELGKDWEGIGNGLCLGPIIAFAWSDFGKPWKAKIRMAGPGIEPGSSLTRVQSVTTASPRSQFLDCGDGEQARLRPCLNGPRERSLVDDVTERERGERESSLVVSINRGDRERVRVQREHEDISNRQFRRFEMDLNSISSPSLNSDGATVFCVDIRSDLGPSFELQWCNRALASNCTCCLRQRTLHDKNTERSSYFLFVQPEAGERTDEGEARRVWSSAGMQGRGKRGYPEKTRQPATSSGTIPTCGNPGATLPGIEPGYPRSERTESTQRTEYTGRTERIERTGHTERTDNTEITGRTECYQALISKRRYNMLVSCAAGTANGRHTRNQQDCGMSFSNHFLESNLQDEGPSVVQWLDYSPSAKANRVRFPEWPLSYFRIWESGWTISLAGFLGDLPFPPPLHSDGFPYHFASSKGELIHRLEEKFGYPYQRFSPMTGHFGLDSELKGMRSVGKYLVAVESQPSAQLATVTVQLMRALQSVARCYKLEGGMCRTQKEIPSVCQVGKYTTHDQQLSASSPTSGSCNWTTITKSTFIGHPQFHLLLFVCQAHISTAKFAARKYTWPLTSDEQDSLHVAWYIDSWGTSVWPADAWWQLAMHHLVSCIALYAGMKGRGKLQIPEKTRRPEASYGTIPTCENPETREGTIAPTAVSSPSYAGRSQPTCTATQGVAGRQLTYVEYVEQLVIIRHRCLVTVKYVLLLVHWSSARECHSWSSLGTAVVVTVKYALLLEHGACVREYHSWSSLGTSGVVTLVIIRHRRRSHGVIRAVTEAWDICSRVSHLVIIRHRWRGHGVIRGVTGARDILSRVSQLVIISLRCLVTVKYVLLLVHWSSARECHRWSSLGTAGLVTVWSSLGTDGVVTVKYALLPEHGTCARECHSWSSLGTDGVVTAKFALLLEHGSCARECHNVADLCRGVGRFAALARYTNVPSSFSTTPVHRPARTRVLRHSTSGQLQRKTAEWGVRSPLIAPQDDTASGFKFKFNDLQARLYRLMCKHADIDCTLVVCCYSGRRRLCHRSPRDVKHNQSANGYAQVKGPARHLTTSYVVILCHDKAEQTISEALVAAHAATCGNVDKPVRLPPRQTGFNYGRVTSRFSHVGIVSDDAAGRRVFLGISCFPKPFHSGAAPYPPRCTLIGSHDLGVKEPPKSLHSLTRALGAETIEGRIRYCAAVTHNSDTMTWQRGRKERKRRKGGKGVGRVMFPGNSRVRMTSRARGRTVSQNKCVYWADGNPLIVAEQAVNLPGEEVRCGMSDRGHRHSPCRSSGRLGRMRKSILGTKTSAQRGIWRNCSAMADDIINTAAAGASAVFFVEAIWQDCGYREKSGAVSSTGEEGVGNDGRSLDDGGRGVRGANGRKGSRNEGAGKREIPEKTYPPAASSGTIPTCNDPGVNPVRVGVRPPFILSSQMRVQSHAQVPTLCLYSRAQNSARRTTLLSKLSTGQIGNEGYSGSKAMAWYDARCYTSCQTMPLVGGFSRGSPVRPALLFRHCTVLTSITLIGSQELAVMSRHTLFTYSAGNPR
ncbi:hypothetical protein PR048_015345 [Dryococelus australis]|uniref:Uncharacterized protein n=1 Tax=Dryococelus australis TaxID=614101 RepID=A0ABQ9HGQ0_9NEOP|nr:hypothetical protein PR048_015345 [Dryococelus australis]